MEITYIPSLDLQERAKKGWVRLLTVVGRVPESSSLLYWQRHQPLSQSFSEDMSHPDLWRDSCLPPETPAHLAEAGIFSVSDTCRDQEQKCSWRKPVWKCQSALFGT